MIGKLFLGVLLAPFILFLGGLLCSAVIYFLTVILGVWLFIPLG